MVALDEELRPTQQSYVEARRLHPHGLAAAALIPLDEIANPAVLLFVETPLGGLPESRVFRALDRISAPQDRRVELEPVLEVAHREQIDVVGHERVDQRVARDHVADHAVFDRLPRRVQRRVDLRKLALNVAQRGLDGVKVEPAGSPVRRRVAARMRRGYWIRSSAARERAATSAGSAM